MVSWLLVMIEYRRSGVHAFVTGDVPVGSVESTDELPADHVDLRDRVRLALWCIAEPTVRREVQVSREGALPASRSGSTTRLWPGPLPRPAIVRVTATCFGSIAMACTGRAHLAAGGIDQRDVFRADIQAKKNEGEGNRTADRKYREGVRRHVESGAPKPAAEEAAAEGRAR
jgi:hypothetical protein